MQVTLQQVAEQAGVSPSTVSRVLNNASVRVGISTRQRIRSVAVELGYRPNGAAHALATGRSNSVALWADNVISSYYAQIICQLRTEAGDHGYDLMIGKAETLPDGSINSSKLMAWQLDGVLTIDLPRGHIPGLKQSLLWGKPFVNIGPYSEGDADFVKIVFMSAAVEAIRHLDAIGCKRIAYLIPDWFDFFDTVHDSRLDGYRLAMSELGKPEEYIPTSHETRQSTYEPLHNHIVRRGCPDGIFCFNDDMAITAHKVVRNLGLSIPEDVAIIGCNGIDDTDYLYPQLTTIVQPVELMCSKAWASLERRIGEPDLPLQQETLDAYLSIRGSTSR